MKKDGFGGANTNKVGLEFENKLLLKETLENIGFVIKTTQFRNIFQVVNKYGIEKGYIGEKPNISFYDFFSDYLSKEFETDISLRKKIISKLMPDKFYFDINKKILYIIECKIQNCTGSTDEKIQTAPYKKFIYDKLLAEYFIKIQFIYIWNEWFENKKYYDVKEYLKIHNVRYFLNELPLEYLGLNTNDD